MIVRSSFIRVRAMYTPKHFEETRLDILHELMRAHALATLTVMTADGLSANHIPMLVEAGGPFGVLRGHVARANPVWREYSPQVEALAIFQGPETYITPSWFATKHETAKAVPTWNYVVVHAYGPLKVVDDRTWLKNHVTALTDKNEASRTEPWRVTDAPAEYIDRLLQEIIGIEIPIARLSGKWKVSQNRTAKDKQGVVDGLMRDGTETAMAMATLVKRESP
jgi:transcriptional regulator